MGAKFDANIPIPERGKAGRPSDHDWAAMKVGDSVLLENRTSKQATSRRGYLWRRYGYRSTQRKTAEGVRVWRVS